MNVYLMVDLEGISGIFTREQVVPGDARYSEGRALMTREVNLAVQYLKEAGVEKVYVRDAHGGAMNLLWDKITADAEYVIMGRSGELRFPGIEDCDYVILLGYHAMAGTLNGILDHSMSSASIQNYWINGEKAGETAIDAGIVGDMGKPVIMVSGDDKVCAEAKALLPWVVTCEVKKALNVFGGMLLTPERSAAMLRKKIFEAVENAPNCKPLVYKKPIKFRVELIERMPLPNTIARPHVMIIDGRTYEVEGMTMDEAFQHSH